MVSPQACRTCSITSGLSGSPALTSSRNDICHEVRSCCTIIRHTVGGAQNVVTFVSRTTSSSDRASKRS